MRERASFVASGGWLHFPYLPLLSSHNSKQWMKRQDHCKFKDQMHGSSHQLVMTLCYVSLSIIVGATAWHQHYLLPFSHEHTGVSKRPKHRHYSHCVNRSSRTIQTLHYMFHCTLNDDKQLPRNMQRRHKSDYRLASDPTEMSRCVIGQIVQSFFPVRYQFCISLASQSITAECSGRPSAG